MNQDQFYAIRQTRAWLKQKPLDLDTETTGFSRHDEVIDLTLIDSSNSQALIDTLIRPTVLINSKAQDIHGITDAHVANMPSFAEMLPKLTGLVKGRLVLAWNYSFDLRLLQQSAAAHQLKLPYIDIRCTMRLYTLFHGEKQTLSNAAQQLSLAVPADLHRAAADAQLCRHIVEAMAATRLPGETKAALQ